MSEAREIQDYGVVVLRAVWEKICAGGGDAVPRVWARAAAHADSAGGGPGGRHPRRRMGRRRTALPVHGELVRPIPWRSLLNRMHLYSTVASKTQSWTQASSLCCTSAPQPIRWHALSWGALLHRAVTELVDPTVPLPPCQNSSVGQVSVFNRSLSDGSYASLHLDQQRKGKTRQKRQGF